MSQKVDLIKIMIGLGNEDATIVTSILQTVTRRE